MRVVSTAARDRSRLGRGVGLPVGFSCSGDDLPAGSVADGDGAVDLTLGDEVFDVQVSMVSVAEESEDFDVGEALVA